MTTDSHQEARQESPEAEGLGEPESQTRDWPAHWFRPGDPRASEAGKLGGRPRKGQSAQDKLLTVVNRDADQILDGMSKEAKKGNTRAFIALWDRAFGVPKQTLQIIRDDDPALAWLAQMTGQVLAPDLPSQPQLPAPSQDST